MTTTLTIVGGTFDQTGGKPSYLLGQLAKALHDKFSVTLVNGGTITDLQSEPVEAARVVIWMPNVSNEEEKLLPDIKKKFPKLMLIQSKRVIEKNYDDFEIVKRLLNSHSNLGIKITKIGGASGEDGYRFSLLDPLGNCWLKDGSVENLADALTKRIYYLEQLHRTSSDRAGPAKSFILEGGFLELVKQSGHKFDSLIRAANPERFLGNASTRCMHGFPGVRANGNIFVSKRNVDKTMISSEQFVEVELNPAVNGITYYGDNKPSVDTPIQVELFRYYKNINYMIHGHVYLEGIPITDTIIPCGYLEEAEVIKRELQAPNTIQFAVNLRGHGCLIAANNLRILQGQLSYPMVSRPVPELQAL